MITDTYGHQASDKLLKDAISVVKSHLNQEEEVGRWSSEQFLIFSAGGTRQDVFLHCEKLRNAVNRHTFRIDGKPMQPLTLSFGISRIDMHNNFEHSFKKADKALRSAKENGNNQVALASY
jgi:diguanylate cyclase (GGDEF)-like protein